MEFAAGLSCVRRLMKAALLHEKQCAAVKNHRLCWRSVQKRGMGGWVKWADSVWKVIKPGDLRGEQGVPLGVLIDSRELDLHAESEFQVTNCGVPFRKYVFIWNTFSWGPEAHICESKAVLKVQGTYISLITAFQLFIVLERKWSYLHVRVFWCCFWKLSFHPFHI